MSDTVRFFIPDIGTRIKLAKDWQFDLYAHPGNKALAKALGLWDIEYGDLWLLSKGHFKRVLGRPFVPAGTELTIKKAHMGASEAKNLRGLRLYVAKGKCAGDARLEKKRFWAQLADVNKIVCEVLEGPKDTTTMKSAELVVSRWEMMR